MSQTSSGQSFLHVVSTWTEGKCKEESEKAVTELLDNLSYSHCSLEDFLELSTILTEKFLQHVFVESLGRRILDGVCVQLSTAFCDILSRFPGGSTTVKTPTVSSLLTMLQEAVKVIQCTENLIHKIITILSETDSETKLEQILPTPVTTITMLRKSYSHCKNSENIYSDLFKHTSNSLGILFQKTYSLQKSVGVLLSRIKAPSHEGEMKETQESAIQICSGLLGVGEIIGEMDNMLLGATWKLLLGFMHKFQDIINEKISALPYIKILCQNIQECIKYTMRLSTQSSHLLSSGDESTQKAFARSCKFSTFFMSSLWDLIKIFKAHLDNEACEMLTSFVSELYITMKPKLQVCERLPDSERTFSSEMLSESEKVIDLLISKDHFMNFVLPGFETQEPHFGSLWFLVCATQTLVKNPALIHKWTSEGKFHPATLVQHLLNHAARDQELNAPLRVFGCTMSLYDAVVISICTFILNIPTSTFPRMEETLLGYLLSHKPQKTCLASDIVVFICRSSQPLCDHYFNVFCELLMSIPPSNKLTFSLNNIVTLLKRIAGSLSQRELKKLEFNITRWPWNQFCSPQGLSEQVVQNNITYTCKELKNETNSLANEKIQSHHLIKLTASFENLLMYPNMTTDKDFIDSLLKFWSRMQEPFSTFKTSLLLKKLLSLYLRLLNHFTANMESSDIATLLSGIREIVGVNTSVRIKILVCQLLTNVQEKASCSEIEEELCKIFAILILDTNWRVSSMALNAFEKISQHSSGTRLLEKCAEIPDLAKTIEAHFTFESTGSSFRANIIPEKNEANADHIYKLWRDRQFQMTVNFEKDYTLNSQTSGEKNTCNLLQSIRKINQRLSELNGECRERYFGSSDLTLIQDELRACGELLNNLNANLNL